MIPLLLLAALLPAPGPGVGAPAEDSGAEGWRLLDGVAIQAGDRIVTLSEFQRFFERGLEDRPLTTAAELDRELQKAKAAVITQQLAAQAGAELGVDRTQVDRLVDRSLADLRRERGVDGFLEYLEEQGQDGLSVGEEQTAQLLQTLWEQKHTGQSAAGERPILDRFVRPGTLRVSYRVNRTELGQPDRVRLRLLDLSTRAVGGLEPARLLAGELLERLRAGADFGELVLEYGVTARETLGLTEEFAVPSLVDEELRAFAERAEVGELSEVQEIVREGKVLGFRIARLEEREPGSEAPPFTDPRVQDFLRDRLLRAWESGRLGEARETLEANAFVWSSPLLAPAPEQGAGGSPQGAAGASPRP